ncbi:MAG TPA: tetratricopeptide repeat protein [Myxococcota bacterium]|nr:tetratricopeptide repeat protein [Myxococcota bacterium]HRY93943.1 tetratricopeptide repeat protein [Myxococcota bacterium]
MVCAGCASGPSPRELFDAARRDYQLGEVLSAYRTLKPLKLDETIPDGEYDALLREVAEATQFQVETFLARADESFSEGDILRAVAYYRDLLSQLPETDGLHRAVSSKATPVLERVQGVMREADELVAQAREAFSAGRVDDARQKLEEARWQLLEASLEVPMTLERLLDECERRLPGEVEELAQAEDAALSPGAGGPRDPGQTRPPAAKRRRPTYRPRPAPRRRTPAPAEVAEAPALVDPLETQAAALLAEGQALAKKGETVGAIVALRKVLRIRPSHQAAKKALAELEPARRKLVDEWMAKATELFAKERLEEAAPYYDRVLQIDPDNIRAREGRQMNQRLQELKARQK